jgi:dTDP-4-dehydrorhamnose reductase
VTGGRGQLGTEIADILASGTAEAGPIPREFRGASVVSVDFEELDITNATAVRDFLGEGSFDAVINCAAMTDVDGCESDRETALKVNALGARNLALAASGTGAKLVHVSTDYVFSGTGDTPYAEWDRPDPQTVYGASKLLGERYVRESCARSFVVRTAWLYGYHGANFVKTIVKAATERGELKVVDDQIGTPTNANDLALHLLKLAASDEYGIFHCTGQGQCSWYDFARAIVEEFEIACVIEPCGTDEFPRPAKRPKYSVLENLALGATVGDEMRPWREALAAYAARVKTEGTTRA